MTSKDVDRLLILYKDVVAKYTTLRRAINVLPPSHKEPILRRLESQGVGQPIMENKFKASQPKDEIK